MLRSRVAATLALGLLQAPAARAQDPCAEDVKQLCAEVKPGGGRVQRCLKENTAKLSPACNEKLAADERRMLERVEEFLFACRPDVTRLCSEVKQGSSSPTRRPGEPPVERARRHIRPGRPVRVVNGRVSTPHAGSMTGQRSW